MQTQNAHGKRFALWGGLGALVVSGLVFAFWPAPLGVDLVVVEAAPMTVTVSDEGETRVRDVFVVSAPLAGRARRIEVDPGDVVTANQTLLAEIEPAQPLLLDPRSEAQARAHRKAADSAEAAARAEVEKAQADLAFQRSELQRARELTSNGVMSDRDLEAAEQRYRSGLAALARNQSVLQVRAYELERARAELMSPSEVAARRAGCECVSIVAPIDGRVLRVLHESEGIVAAGEPLIEIGDPERLEVVADLLSTDAVSVSVGQRARLENWGGEGALEGRVRRVEPFGYTKVSALGIEEQRVNVVLDITSPHGVWSRLAHGFQLDVHVVLWESDTALQVPLTALFRDGESWAVFVREAGRARIRSVVVGRRNGQSAEILDGLQEGDAVVVYPSERIEAGIRLEPRGPSSGTG